MSQPSIAQILATAASVWGWVQANVDLEEIAYDFAVLTAGQDLDEDEEKAILVSMIDQIIPEESLGEWADKAGDVVFPLVATHIARLLHARIRRQEGRAALAHAKANIARARAAVVR